MSEKELNSYRLTSIEDPTDEMLSHVMKEIAEDVKERNAAVERQFMANLKAEASRRSELRKMQ